MSFGSFRRAGEVENVDVPDAAARPGSTGRNEGAVAVADMERHRDAVYNLVVLCGVYLAEDVAIFRSASRHGRFCPYSMASRAPGEMELHKSGRLRLMPKLMNSPVSKPVVEIANYKRR